MARISSPPTIAPSGRFWSIALALLNLSLLAGSAKADDWPQWLGPKRDGVWRETGILEKFPKDGPKVRWRTAIGMGYAGPAVAEGRVFVFDRVLGRDAKNPDDPFSKNKIACKERILCLNENDGSEIWKHEYDCSYEISYASGPRTTPSIVDGKVYTLD